MAKFRDSTQEDNVLDAADSIGAPSASGERVDTAAQPERSMGDILAELRNLTVDQVEKVLQYQRANGVRFGEAAVALGLATKEDVLFALSQQFHYPYAPEGERAGSPELVALNEPFSPRAEGFRALRSQLMMRIFAEGAGQHRALAVISPARGDGRTYSAANLAVALAQLGGRTLLVDADMRNPRLHEVFKLSNQTGLSGILSGRADKQVIQQAHGVSSLFVLPVGTTPPNPLELVERPAFGLLMRELSSKFDHVVVDTPAATHGADASVVAARVGAALVIARKNTTRVALLQDLVASFEGSPVKLAGVVLNEF